MVPDAVSPKPEEIDQPRADAPTGRAWSFAPTFADVAVRRAEANRLVGEELRAVRYFTIDDRTMNDPGRPPGPRTTEPSESPDGVWVFGQFHSIDFGVEIETAAGRIFSVTWDLPGAIEGIGIREARMLGSALRPGWDGAVWDVASSSMWAPLLGRHIEAVSLDYRPWSDYGDWWCPTITITAAATGVVLALGEVDLDGALAPSADNVLVVAYPPCTELRIPN